MTSIDVRNNSAIMKRAAQLKRWEESDTNQQPSVPKPERGIRIKFSPGCIFLAACMAGDKEEVLNMLEQGADINTANVDGLTALHQACIDDNLEMVEFLVEHGADINRQDNEGWTALHATASCGFVSIARYLVEHGADVAAVNSDGDLAIDLAADIQHLPMIDFMQQVLTEQQIDCTKARQAEEQQMLNDAKKWLRSDASEIDRPHPKSGHTALHVAAAKGYTKVLSLLLAGRANVDAQDNDGWTALHAAAHWGQKEAAEMLVDAMADMEIRNYSAQTCIDVADRKMVKFLEELKATNKRIKRRPSSQISRISDNIDNHIVDKAHAKIIRVEVRPENKEDRHINDETYLPAQKAANDITTTLPAITDEEAPWRRNNVTRASTIVCTLSPENTIKNQVPEKGVIVTTTPTTNNINNETSDVILRRTQSFENDEKFYQKYKELRARIKANSCPIISATVQNQQQPQQQNSINNNNYNNNKRNNILTNHHNIASANNNNTSDITSVGNLTTTTATVTTKAELSTVNSSCSSVHPPTSMSASHHQNAHYITTATATPLTISNNNNNNNNIVQRSTSLKDHKQMYNRKSPPITPPTVPKAPNAPSNVNSTPIRSDTELDKSSRKVTTSNVTATHNVDVSLIPSAIVVDNNNFNQTSVKPKQSAGHIIKNFFKSFVPPVRDEESETQRKAHAKRVRETRRSTQGVTLDEIKSAEELVKKKNSNINNSSNNNDNNSGSSISNNNTDNTAENRSKSSNANSNNNNNKKNNTDNDINCNNEMSHNTTTKITTQPTTTTPPPPPITTTTTTIIPITTNSTNKAQGQRFETELETLVTATEAVAEAEAAIAKTIKLPSEENKSGIFSSGKLTENVAIEATFTLLSPSSATNLNAKTRKLTTETGNPVSTSITLITRNQNNKANDEEDYSTSSCSRLQMMRDDEGENKVDMTKEKVLLEGEKSHDNDKEVNATFTVSPRKSLTSTESVAATFKLTTSVKHNNDRRLNDVNIESCKREQKDDLQNIISDNHKECRMSQEQLTAEAEAETESESSITKLQHERSKSTNEVMRAAFFNTSQTPATITIAPATLTPSTNITVNYGEKRTSGDNDNMKASLINSNQIKTHNQGELNNTKQFNKECDRKCNSNNNSSPNADDNDTNQRTQFTPVTGVGYNYTSRRSLDSSLSLPSSPLHHNSGSNVGRYKESAWSDTRTPTTTASYFSCSLPLNSISNNTTERRPSWRLKFDSGSKFKLEDASSGDTHSSNNSTIIPSAPAVIAAANLSSSIAQRRISNTSNNNTGSSSYTNTTSSSYVNTVNSVGRPLSAPPAAGDISTTVSAATITSDNNPSHHIEDNSTAIIQTPRQKISTTTSTSTFLQETIPASTCTTDSVATSITDIKSSENDKDKENDNRGGLAAQGVIQRRRKPKRRSTGVVHMDMDDLDPDRQDSANDGEEKESGSEQRQHTTGRSRLENVTSSASTSLAMTDDKKSCENEDNIDYKALWEAVKMENEKLKQQLKKKDDEITQTRTTLEKLANTSAKNLLSENEKRERRAMERKLSELEEELKQLEIYKTENQRLKEENGALIRVISKLSK